MNITLQRLAEIVDIFHKKLGSNKTFKCPQCQIEMDIDINAARNILLRFLTLNRAESSDLALGPTP
ncbi:hypothetical protein C2G38_2084840 [Gigaspora rosea]|uniref:Cas12f1-like TNB domain-containing protein n=1 Tax=Gigaspora rosea TaxID=44941 RepID=A0A397VFX3_9GLOM|nr:hypothetical protein C2G38_2084840 [Gigaspora rosea]